MDGSVLEQYRISDLVEWFDQKKLTINTDYQRGPVWSPTARSFFIDTILRGFPIPKLYIRTLVDLNTRTSVREVVDGQQRVRTIVDFAKNRIRLTKRARNLEGLDYDHLNDEQKERFLSYPIGVAQMINASMADVLEVFARLNSYTVTLNEPEKRHAKFQGEFKWGVYDETEAAEALWTSLPILTVRERVRMLDYSLMAEMFGILTEGVKNAGQPYITKLYERNDERSAEDIASERAQVHVVWQFIQEKFGDTLRGTKLAGSPHFLMLFAAVCHAKIGIPQGDLDQAPQRDPSLLTDIAIATANLSKLATIIELADQPRDQYALFWKASQASTHRIASRKERFPIYLNALKATVLP